MRTVDEIIVHCSATRPSWMEKNKTSEKVAEIKSWHTDPKSKGGRGWKDIGYHYVIDRDGTLATGRPVSKIGAHTLGHNKNSVGICLLGGHGSSENDSFEDNFTEAQDKALREFISDQRAAFPTIQKVSGHNEYAAKACPGFSVAGWYESGIGPSLVPLATASTMSQSPVRDVRFDGFFDFVQHLAAVSEGRFDRANIDTKFGVSIEDLAQWRQVSPSSLDRNALQYLTVKEAKQLYKALYYSACRCSEMPDRTALVVFDVASQIGSKEAVKLVQRAFNGLGLTVDGKPLAVDGLIGRLTMGAVKKTDPSVLADALLDEAEARLGEQNNAEITYARIASVREFIETLPKGSGVRPRIQMIVSDNKFELDDILKVATAVKGGDKSAALGTVARLILDEDEDDSRASRRNKEVARLILGINEPAAQTPTDVSKITKGPDGEPPLTPVNAALGTTLGRALNGKKSVSGIGGLLLTTLLPQLGLSGDIVNFVGSNSSTLLTIFSLLTGWGFLGKIDKAVRLVGMVQGQKID